MKEKETSLAVIRQQEGLSLTSRGVVAPQISPDDARAAAGMLQQLKEAVLADADYLWAVDGKVYPSKQDAENAARSSGKKIKGHPIKSGCLKLGQAFGLRVDVVGETWGEDGSYVDVVARATHPCGASAEDLSSCERDEKKRYDHKKKEFVIMPLSRHNMRTTAYTRARNRAILALIGGGEVSGEELTAGGEIEPGVYESPGPMRPYQKKESWATEKSDFDGAPAPVDAGTKRGGRPVDAGEKPIDWPRFWVAMREIGVTQDECHAIMQVDSLKECKPADVRALPARLNQFLASDTKDDVPRLLAELAQDLDCAESLAQVNERWLAWSEQVEGKLSPLAQIRANEIAKKFQGGWMEVAAP